MLHVFLCYLLVTPGYLVVTGDYLVGTSGYFWLPLLLVTSGYFLLLLVTRFSNKELEITLVQITFLKSYSQVLAKGKMFLPFVDPSKFVFHCNF